MKDAYRPLLEQACRSALDYVETIAERRVAPSSEDLAAMAAFDEPLGESGHGAAGTLDLLHRVGAPATMASTGGRFFGLVTGGALPVTVAANWMATAWDQVEVNDVTAPVAFKLERVATRWVLELLDLPRDASVGFVTGTSMAHFTCLAAARAELLHRAGYDLARRGAAGAPRLRAVVSADIHLSVIKALVLVGFGLDEIERVAVDEQGRVRSDAMPALDDKTVVIVQAGNVNSGSFDPFEAICDAADASGAWVHVDGAIALWAAASARWTEQTRGMNRAASWTTDTHKTLNTPYDCGLAICRHSEAVARVMAFQASYLDIDAKGVTMPILLPEMSRRARGVEVWAALRTLGREGLCQQIQTLASCAQQFAEGLESMGFTVLNEVAFNQVVATMADVAQLHAVMRDVQRSGECWFGPTQWLGRSAIRISISSWCTSGADVERSLRAIEAAMRRQA